MTDREVVIVSAVRTPIGSFCGSLSSLKASDLGSIVIKESFARVKQLQPTDVAEVIFGQGLIAGEGQNPARQAAIKAGLPISVPAYHINMLCGSGLKCVTNACATIKSGEGDVVIAGGQECMSRAPHAIYLRSGIKLGPCSMIDTMIHDGLTDAFEDIHMGVTAENIAEKYGISRDEQDAYALQSQQKVAAAIKRGDLAKEIVPVLTKLGKETVLVSTDEFPKSDCSIESLRKLKPVFKTNGSVTAGNASGINDGAAAVILMSAEAAASKKIVPLAHVVAYAQCGMEPSIMGMGPVPAITKVLEKAKWSVNDVDLFEINEAFAVQALACIRELKLDPSKVNIFGGAIALGHPIGNSGARVLVTLLNALQITGGKKGVASLCIGGGMGIAIAVERK